MAACVGLYEVVKIDYLKRRINQTRKFAEKLAHSGLPVLLPPGGHAVYIDMEQFFVGTKMKMEDFGGVGFAIELLR
jgi:tryptophanase